MNSAEPTTGRQPIPPGWRQRVGQAMPELGGFGYLALGILWIWLSDHAGAAIFTSIEQLTAFQTYKGALFVGVSALTFFLLLRASCRLVQRLPLLERQVRDTEQQHRGLLELSPDGVVVHEGGRIIYANRVFRQALGLSDVQPLDGVLLTNLVEPSDRPLIEQQLAPLSVQPGCSTPVELRLRARGGRQELEVEHASHSVDVGGRLVVQSHFRDLGARNHARRELELANQDLEQRITARTRELEAANEALQSYTYSVAHDLRAPVAHVEGFARALQAAVVQGDTARAAQYARRILSNTSVMGQMIEGLLKLSRAEHAQLQHEVVDSRRLVEQVIGDFTGTSARQRIAIGPLAPVYGDRATLRQVWDNLISNALKYSVGASDPLVRISSVERSSEIVFSICDRGIGFDGADADKLFGLFQRLPGAAGFAGTGIGLAIVKRIVERHGGRVWATGQPGQGAAFFFALPNRG